MTSGVFDLTDPSVLQVLYKSINCDDIVQTTGVAQPGKGIRMDC
jgi:hypothetical protein